MFRCLKIQAEVSRISEAMLRSILSPILALKIEQSRFGNQKLSCIKPCTRVIYERTVVQVLEISCKK